MYNELCNEILINKGDHCSHQCQFPHWGLAHEDYFCAQTFGIFEYSRILYFCSIRNTNTLSCVHLKYEYIFMRHPVVDQCATLQTSLVFGFVCLATERVCGQESISVDQSARIDQSVRVDQSTRLRRATLDMRFYFDDLYYSTNIKDCCDRLVCHLPALGQTQVPQGGGLADQSARIDQSTGGWGAATPPCVRGTPIPAAPPM